MKTAQDVSFKARSQICDFYTWLQWKCFILFCFCLYCLCHSEGAPVLLYCTFLSHVFPLPCGAGSTVPREGFHSSVTFLLYYALFLCVFWLWYFLYSVVPHPVSFVVSWAFMTDAARQAEDADSSRAPGLTSDPVIIERTIGLVLGPSTALYEPFLKHCTLTNKAVGTIWRALSKPPQRRQGPDLCPLWLLVGTSSAIIPELAFSRAEHSRRYSDVAKYIFDIYYLLTVLFVYWFLWPLRLVWLLVCCLYKEVYLQFFKCVSFWLHGCCGDWEGGPVNQV